MRSLIFATAILGLAAFGSSANAVVVNNLPNGVLAPMPELLGAAAFGAGPQVFGTDPAITWTSTTADSVFGFTGSYSLADNGTWSGNSPYMGLNLAAGTMTMTLSVPVAGIGAFLNYCAFDGEPVGDLPTLAVYDINNNLLESFVLDLSTTGENQGLFVGFQETSAIIASFTLSGSFIVARDITTTQTAAVPAPATLALLGFGLVGLAAARRRTAA